jgi:hypothetical protein
LKLLVLKNIRSTIAANQNRLPAKTRNRPAVSHTALGASNIYNQTVKTFSLHQAIHIAKIACYQDCKNARQIQLLFEAEMGWVRTDRLA